MAVTVDRYGRGGARELIEELSEWIPRRGGVSSLHPGDIGWHLRLDDVDLSGAFVAVRDRGEVVAVGLVEDEMLRPTIRRTHTDDPEVAAALGDLADALTPGQTAYTDAPVGSAYEAWLAGHGWEVSPDPWAVLFRPLSPSDGDYEDPMTRPLSSDQDIADRVAVQFAAFEHSTFTVYRWRQMATGPGYEADLDLLRRDGAGTPVAAATGWLAGADRVGILEPVGTHRDHVGAGHGKAVTLATIAALARAGASGVSVQTPLSNVSAVRAYQSCGMGIVEHLHPMTRPAG